MPEDVHVAWERGGDADDLLARLLVQVLGDARGPVTRACPQCRATDHGRPVAPGAHLSLAGAPGLALVAVSAHSPVGVDVERLGTVWPEGSDGLLLHPDDRAGTDQDRTRLWVRKESLLKATGEGLRREPATIHLPEVAGITQRDLEIDGYAACVTVLGTGVEVTTAEVAARSR